MLFYADTSALMKRYVRESGTDHLLDLLAEAEFLFTSALTELEMIAGLERMKKMGRLDSPSCRIVAASMDQDLLKGSLSVLGISQEVVSLSRRVIKQRQLRVPDAIQLSSALLTQRRSHTPTHFLCADQKLLDAARLEGLRCLDVSQ